MTRKFKVGDRVTRTYQSRPPETDTIGSVCDGTFEECYLMEGGEHWPGERLSLAVTPQNFDRQAEFIDKILDRLEAIEARLSEPRTGGGDLAESTGQKPPDAQNPKFRIEDTVRVTTWEDEGEPYDADASKYAAIEVLLRGELATREYDKVMDYIDELKARSN